MVEPSRPIRTSDYHGFSDLPPAAATDPKVVAALAPRSFTVINPEVGNVIMRPLFHIV